MARVVYLKSNFLSVFFKDRGDDGKYECGWYREIYLSVCLFFI